MLLSSNCRLLQRVICHILWHQPTHRFCIVVKSVYDMLTNLFPKIAWQLCCLMSFLCEMKSEGLTFVKMQRGRWFCSEEALRLILNNTAEDSFSSSEDDEQYQQFIEKEMRDECEEQEEQDYDNIHICSEGILESDEEEDREEETYNSAVSINYSSSAFEQHRRRRNIVKTTARNVAHPRNELESFPDVAFQIINGFCSKTIFLLTDIKLSLIFSETIMVQHWSDLPNSLIWTQLNMCGPTSVGEYSSRFQRLYSNSSGYCLTSKSRFLKTPSSIRGVSQKSNGTESAVCAKHHIAKSELCHYVTQH